MGLLLSRLVQRFAYSRIVQAKTELLLYEMLWGFDTLLSPGYRKLDGSFEGWAYRNGFLRQVQRLERASILEKMPGGPLDRIYRLSEKGRLLALGGRDPETEWARPWDGLWRCVLFDLAKDRDTERREIHRLLREYGFGCLQGSLWIGPHRPESLMRELKGERFARSLVFIEGRPFGGETDARIVGSAWDFNQLENDYEEHAALLKKAPKEQSSDVEDRKELLRWAQREFRSWKRLMHSDPLLPEILWPKSYPGRKTWDLRVSVLGRLSPAAAKARSKN